MKIKTDPKIMQELLSSPGVKENVEKMTPEMLEWFKETLVKEGVYAKFVTERNSKRLKQAWKGKVQ